MSMSAACSEDEPMRIDDPSMPFPVRIEDARMQKLLQDRFDSALAGMKTFVEKTHVLRE
jgi:hypothetical protein